MSLFTNPLFPGDYPDPSVLRDGDDYYCTHSSFNYAPGLLVWHSRDLLNWRPLGYALQGYAGDVWAPELIKHGDTYYLYYFTQGGEGVAGGNYVVTAPHPAGPWSTPVKLNVGWIDPGHVVGPDGARYLYVSDGRCVTLSADGTSVTSDHRHLYKGWPYPEHWRTEGMCLEGPKFTVRDGWYYLVTAEGGTAGPATSHMVIVARSRHPEGPWEDSPHNPIVRTASRDERWWARGHGTLVDGPDGRWWIVYHGYLNGFVSLGRQTLMEPIEWTADGWPVAPMTADVARALPAPTDAARQPFMALDDDFVSSELGLQWRFWSHDGRGRWRTGDGLRLAARGDAVGGSGPLAVIAQDPAYEVEVDVELSTDAGEAGLLLWYSERAYCGIALTPAGVAMRHFVERGHKPFTAATTRASLRIVNDRHEIEFHYRLGPTGDWIKHPRSIEVAGFNHNTFGQFLSLRPALYCTAGGSATFRRFRYLTL